MRDLTAREIFIIAVVIGVTGWFLYLVRDILLPFVLSAFFTYLLSPLIFRIESFGLKKIISVVILYLCFFVVFAGILVYLVPKAINELAVLRNNAPRYFSETKGLLSDFQFKIEDRYPFVKEKQIFDTASKKVEELFESEVARIPGYVLGIFSLFSIIVLIPVLTFFMLLGSAELFQKMMEAIPPRYVETTLSLFYEADSVLGRYIRGQMVETSFVGVLSIVGLLALGIDYAVLIGAAAGIANMIPYVGPFVGFILAAFVGLLEYKTAMIVIKVAVLFSVIQFLDNNLIQPIVIGRGVNLSPLTIVFSLLAGAQIFGILGMIIAVPVAGIIKTVLTIIFKPRAKKIEEKAVII
ncbi:MAG: AI-2E family transporter [Endomicrobiales bacterium]|nr:AI-2E family transporter [Endomicrobiales bacterium]